MTATSRLKVGVDVPWVTSWSGETQTGVSRCPSVDGQLAVTQQIAPGEGHPLYSRNHLFRQRKSVREMLCPMCGAPTAAGDRWSQTAKRTAAGNLRSRGFGPALPVDMADDQALLDCGAIAPLHRACAETAARRCPHLSQMDDLELKRFPEAWVIIPLWIQAKPPGPDAKNTSVVTFLQLVGVET
jgi:hypothetical protein